MAFDKMVDSAQLDAGLTKIANAIRSKSGTSSSLAFPDAMVAAIGNISTGSSGSSSSSGLPTGISSIATGVITFSEDTKNPTITHNMGVAPTFAVVFAEGPIDLTEHNTYVVMCSTYKMSSANNIGTYSGFGDTLVANNGKVSSQVGNCLVAMFDYYFTTTEFTILMNHYLKAGVRYRWICGTYDLA
jgi:hypothetical protein